MRPSRSFLIGGGGGADALADAGMALLRLFAGLALAFGHGINKLPPSERFVTRIEGFGFPLPEVFAWMAGFAEFGGGLLLAVGVLTRPVATLILLNMTVVAVFGHMLQGDTFRQTELALLFWFVALLFLVAGAGRYSIDGFIRSRYDRRTVSRYVR